VETENVDAIINVGGVRAALELVSYRQRDEYYEVEPADSRTRELIREALTEANLSQFTIHIDWAMEPRTNRAAALSAHRARVPRGREAKCFAEEVAALAARVQNDRTFWTKRIEFCIDADDRKQNPAPGWAYLDRKPFRLLSSYCCSIQLSPCAVGPVLQTAVNFRVVGLDETHLASVVRDKIGKLGRYRDGIGGKQLWLAVYSDGRDLSTACPPGFHDDALTVIRQEIRRANGSFDSVWWVEKTGFLDAAELYEVPPGQYRAAAE
jgi:hypothetical protein